MPELYHILKMITEGHTGEARQELAEALRRDPTQVEAWSLMALAVGQPAQKADCYRRVLALDPTNENARYQLAALEARQKAADEPEPAAPSTGSGFVTRPMPASSLVGAFLQPPPAAPELSPAEKFIQSQAASAPLSEITAQPGAATGQATPDNPSQSTPAAAPTPAPAAEGKQSAQAYTTTPQKPGESCSQQLGYFGVCILILSIGGMLLGLGSSLTGEALYDSPPQDPAAMICLGVMALVILPLYVYLAHKGWDTPPEQNLLAKIAFLFVVALPTPIGWYWMGRGASRLVQAWVDRSGQKTRSPRKQPI